MINVAAVCFPIESETQTKSDHGLVCYECILERPATFAWQMHEYVKKPETGTAKFNDLIKQQLWDQVYDKFPEVDGMVESFQRILNSIMSQCFSWKRARQKSNESPWLTDGLRHPIKKRLSIFRSEGRSIKWKHLDTSIKKSIELRKAVFF